MQVTQDYGLPHFREEVWHFTRACENLIKAAQYVTLEEKAVITTYITGLQAQLQSVQHPPARAHARTHR